ncbi:MAG TPA: type IV pilus secretin PilQ, partial [Syntrophorhabdaceae bacterium]|nr:type IV pilus secretin PilQ [Syntrophorhabdaceae bacterium]HQM80373.1 type IV pilus secretin PilQ [Syntrophorhabdaceae bacterium]
MSKKIIIPILIILCIVPLLCFAQASKKPAPRVSFDFIGADVRNVLRALTEVSGKNIVISDDVKDIKVTMKLDNIPWDDAFDIVIKNYKLAKMEEESLIRVTTYKTFLDVKKQESEEKAAAQRARLEKLKQGEEMSTETIFLSYANPADMVKVLQGDSTGGAAAAGARKGFLSEYGTITQVPWNNALIVKDTKENVAAIMKVIKQHDTKPEQIQIDCRIVQATSDFSKEIGIQWGQRYTGSSIFGSKSVEITGAKDAGASSAAASYTATTGLVALRGTAQYPYNVNLPAAVGRGSGGTLGIFIGSVADSFMLDVQLSALESDGKGKILSSPKVITSDNKKATITQGKSIPYQTVSQSGTQTQFAEATLGLEVTPTVTKDGYIKLDVIAKKDSADFINTSAGVPTIDKKQAQTMLYVKDGETAVIGGIYEREENEGESGVPLLKNIPLFGWLFKKETTKDKKTELLIFITPLLSKIINFPNLSLFKTT